MGLEQWRALWPAFDLYYPTEYGFSPHLLRQVLTALGYLTWSFLPRGESGALEGIVSPV